jgi:putative MATE family efflux protein
VTGGGPPADGAGVETEDPEGAPALPAGAIAVAAAAPGAARADDHGYGAIWQMSWPVMLSLLLANTIGLVDIAMVGRLGPQAMAAVGYATQFHQLSQAVLLAVGVACVALMSRAIGAGDLVRARAALAASLAVAALAAAALVAAVLSAGRFWLELLGAEPAVVDLTLPYLVLVLGSTVPMAGAMTVEFGLRAQRDTRTPLAIAFLVAAVKIAGNVLLMFGLFGLPRLELVGAGLATVVSQVLGLAMFAAVVLRAPEGSPLRLAAGALGRTRELLADVVRIALPGLGERLAMNLALLVYFRILAEYGTVAVAAYTVGIRVLAFSWLPGNGFGVASATLVGHALGANDPRAARRAGWRSTRLALGVAVAIGAPCALARTELAHLFVTDAATVAALEPFLLALALCQPFLQAHFALGGALRGAGDTMTPFLAAAAGNWALRVPLACLFAFGLRLDLTWVWYTIVTDHLTRAVWLAWSFRRGHWVRARA